MRKTTQTAIIVIALALSFAPRLAFAQTLQQALGTQWGDETVDTKSCDIAELNFDEFQERTDEYVDSLFEEATKLANEAKRARDDEIQRQLARERAYALGEQIAESSEFVASPGNGWCAKYVSLCYQAAGYAYPGGNACDLYWKYCTSSDVRDMMPGMVIAVPTHTRTYLGGIYGHCGILVERGEQFFVRQNVGVINEVPVTEWISTYGTTVEPKWGFAADISF